MLAILVCVDGLAQSMGMSEITAGSFNPVLIPVLVLLLGFEGFRTYFRTTSKHTPLFSRKLLLGAFLLSIVPLVLWFSQGGDPNKAIRDFLCINLVALAFSFWQEEFRESIDVKRLGRTFGVMFIGILFPLSFVLLGEQTDRYGGFVLSRPLFGTLLVLALANAYYARIGRALLLVLTLLTLWGVFLSGTRTALLLFFVLLLPLAWQEAGARRTRQSRMFTAVLRYIGLVLIAVFLAFVADDLMTVFEEKAGRLASVEDIEAGSIATRLSWYQIIFADIERNGYWGAFGPGASEERIGFITHFDFLRYWYDYSALFLLGFIFLISRLCPTSSRMAIASRAFIVSLYFLVMVLLSTHNLFQSPGSIMVATLVISTLQARHFGGSSQVFSAPNSGKSS